jgi:mannan endo-1,4-beta-mannosidase
VWPHRGSMNKRARHRAVARAPFAALLMLLLTLSGCGILPSGPSGFVKIQDGRFVRDGKPVRFVGANANHIWEPAQFDAERILNDAHDAGINLIRIHLYGSQFYPFDRGIEDSKVVERYWQYLDKVIDLAAKRQISVLLCPTWDFVGFAVAGKPDRWEEDHYQFMTNQHAVDQYKRFWTFLAEHKNTVNGRKYKDDPTIFGYNVINEWEVNDHPAGANSSENLDDVARWYEDIARHIKQVAPNQLVGTGQIGDVQPGNDFLLDTALPSIDFGTIHVYEGQRPPEWVAARGALAHDVLRKPILLEEGNAKGDDDAKANYIRRYWEAAYNAGFDGVLFWDWETSTDGYQVLPVDQKTIAAIEYYAKKFAG